MSLPSEVQSLLALATVFFIVTFIYRRFLPAPDIVPGPYGWYAFTLLPNLPTILSKRMHFHEICAYLSKRFGSMYMLGFGSQMKVLILNGYDEVKEAWNHPDLNDRAPHLLRDALFHGKGKYTHESDFSHSQYLFGSHCWGKYRAYT